MTLRLRDSRFVVDFFLWQGLNNSVQLGGIVLLSSVSLIRRVNVWTGKVGKHWDADLFSCSVAENCILCNFKALLHIIIGHGPGRIIIGCLVKKNKCCCYYYYGKTTCFIWTCSWKLFGWHMALKAVFVWMHSIINILRVVLLKPNNLKTICRIYFVLQTGRITQIVTFMTFSHYKL